jgi:methylmalonyl-CoA mutase cobalamin-binding subunit
MKRPIKVIIAKLGLDIHWRGAMVVAKFLKEPSSLKMSEWK